MAYGKILPGLTIGGQEAPYPVVNERGIRAAAGIMFAIGLSVFWYVFLTRDYRPMSVVVVVFWIEFFLKTVFSPAWSFFGLIGDWTVRKQEPEYVGAIQKRFAWGLGLIMASSMVIVALILGIRGWLPFLICNTCLFFMWLETSMGICVGCKIYNWMLRKNILKTPEIKPACPGGVCSIDKMKNKNS